MRERFLSRQNKKYKRTVQLQSAVRSTFSIFCKGLEQTPISLKLARKVRDVCNDLLKHVQT